MKAYSDATALLMAARMLISDKQAWTTLEEARNKKGNDVEPEAEEAVKFCLMGSLHAFLPSNLILEIAKVRLYEQIGNGFISMFNDYHTHKEVLAVLDAAIDAEA